MKPAADRFSIVNTCTYIGFGIASFNAKFNANALYPQL